MQIIITQKSPAGKYYFCNFFNRIRRSPVQLLSSVVEQNSHLRGPDFESRRPRGPRSEPFEADVADAVREGGSCRLPAPEPLKDFVIDSFFFI